MRRLVLSAAALVMAAAPAGAQLAPGEVIERLPGRWELDPAESSPEAVAAFRCDGNFLTIQIRDEDGRWIYQSRREEAPAARRAPITPVSNGLPSIHIKYEQETRRDDAGRLVEWLLVMPDADHFFWVRTDWLAGGGGRTTMRRRCPDEAVS